MAFNVVRVVPDEELPRSPLRPPEEPIAAALGKIPGIGGFLKGVQQQTSPRGVMGPGVLAQIMAGLQQKATGTGTPQDFYNKSIGTSETLAALAAAGRLPSATFLQRLLGGAGITSVEDAIHNTDPATRLQKLAGGAAIQTGLEGVLQIPKQIGMQFLAKNARKASEERVAAHEAQTAQDIAGDRRQAALDLRGHREQVGQIKAQNAQGKAAADAADEAAQAAHAAQVQDIRLADAQRIRGEKRAYQTTKNTTLATHEAATAAAEQAYAQAKTVHSGQAAQIIMDDAKALVPEWGAFPSTMEGLINGVLGKGQKMSSEAYAKALAAATETARGVDVILPLNDIRKLGVPMKGLASTVTDANMMPTHGVVDAANAIEYLNRMGGKKRDWGVYARTTSALSDLDLGVSEEARAAYKKAQEVIEAIDTSGALRAEGGKTVLDTDRLFEAMHKVKNIDIIRKRGDEDFLTAPLVGAAKGTPQPPAEIPAPVIDPFVPPAKTALPPKPASTPFTPTPAPERPTREPFTPEAPPLGPDKAGEIEGPMIPGTHYQRAKAGALLGILGGLATGTGGGHLYSGPAIVGAGAGAAIPNQWITKAPGSAPLEALLGELAQLGGTGAREAILPEGGSVGRLTPEELAKMDAEIAAAAAAKQTAAANPALQLDLSRP